MVFVKIKIDHKISYLIKCNSFLKGIDAITIYNLIFIRANLAKSLPLLVHEAVHVRQWRTDKLFIFLYTFNVFISNTIVKPIFIKANNIIFER